MAVKQTFTGDKTALEQAYRDLLKQVVGLEQANQRLADTTRRATEGNNRAQAKGLSLTDQGISKVASLASGYLSAAAALHGFNTELEKQHELQSRASAMQLSVADTQAQVVKQMVGMSARDQAGFLNQLKGLSEEKKFDINKINLAAAEGLGAGGAPEQVMEAVKAAVPLVRDKPEDLPILVGAVLDLARATGNPDAQANLGLLQSSAAQTRITSLFRQARNASPAIANTVDTVKDPDRENASREAAAFFSWLTLQTSDFSGEMSGTTEISAGVQMRDFFEKGTDITAGGRKFKYKPKTDPGTLFGRFDYLRDNARDRELFLANSSFERKFQVPMEQLFRNPENKGALAKLKDNIHLDPQVIVDLGNNLKSLTPEMQLATQHQHTTASVQQLQLQQTLEARTAEARRILEESLTNTSGYTQSPFGSRWLVNKGASSFSQDLKVWLGEGPEESAISMLRERQEEVRMRKRTILFNRNDGDLTPVDQLNKEERRDYDFLERQIQSLKETMERVAVSNEKIEQRDAARDQRRPAATGAAAEPGRHRER